MHIDMPKQLKEFIQNEVLIGNYSNESEVVRDAVRQLSKSKYQYKLQNLRAELALGMKDIEEGRVVEYTPKLFEEIKKRAMVKYKNNIPPRASVMPNEA